MPNPYFWTFELIVAGLFGLCARHARQRGPAALLVASSADAYLSKPLPYPGLLIERVQALLDEAGLNRPSGRLPEPHARI